MTLELLIFAGVVLAVGAIGVAIGILLIGPRLNRWAERQDDEANGERD